MLGQVISGTTIVIVGAEIGVGLHGLVRRVGMRILRRRSSEQADAYTHAIHNPVGPWQWCNGMWRGVGHPLVEEFGCRGIPIATFLQPTTVDVPFGIILWFLLTFGWIRSHDGQIRHYTRRMQE